MGLSLPLKKLQRSCVAIAALSGYRTHWGSDMHAQQHARTHSIAAGSAASTRACAMRLQ
jgi:hypothetical protein